MDAGADEHPGMGKDGHSLVGLAFEFVKKCRHALVLLQEALASCRGLVDIIVVPFLQVRVPDFVIQLHFPLAHVHLQQPVVGHGIVITAVGGEFAGARQGRREDLVKRQKLLQRLASQLCLLLKGVAHGHVGLSVARALGHINAGMSNQEDFHYISH